MASGPALPGGFVRTVADALGPGGVLDDPEVTAAWATDWTGRYRCAPPVVVRPSDAAHVAEVVAAAREHGVALVPVGGNTGLVGGSTPCDGEVVVDLRRLAAVTDVEVNGG